MACPARLEPMEGNEIVIRHLAGDPRAFAELVRQFHPRLLNFTHRLIGDRERAEDLVQETFVRVARHLHRFDTRRKFSSWVFVIASNLAKNELRSRQRNPLVFYESRQQAAYGQGVLQLEDHRNRPDQDLADGSVRDLVQATLKLLPAKDRQVLVLREFEGLSYDEIGDSIGCKLGAVKSRLNRARSRFAALISPHLD